MKTFTPEFEIKGEAIVCNYKSQYELMYAMARFQEFYENPYLKQSSFSRMDLQAIQPDYYVSWNGCNFPCRIFREMFNMGFVFDRHELVIFDFCSRFDKYIIGIHSGNKKTLEHEMAHANYCIDIGYREEMNRRINAFREDNPKKFKILVDKLLKMGYDLSVIPDEIQAYATCGWNILGLDWKIKL